MNTHQNNSLTCSQQVSPHMYQKHGLSRRTILEYGDNI
uniref:Uncharacterized protein n=1 Tax=Arundo donax TaxID=35708 RepID=A0A0A9BHU8_ARUDO